MSLVFEEKSIAANPTDLWNFLTVVENLPQWMPEAEKAELLGSQRAGIGRRQRLFFQGPAGQWQQEQVIIAWEPGRRFGWRSQDDQVLGKPRSDIQDLQTIIILQANAQSTQVRFESSWVPAGLKGQVYSQLALKPSVRRQFKLALAALDRLVQQWRGQ